MRVAVIGTGVFGASAAFHLAREGAAVVAIDPALDGRATAAGAGIVCPWATGLADDASTRLLAGGAQYYPILIEALAECGETETGYGRVGAMLVPADPALLDDAETRIRARAADWPGAGAISRLTDAEAHALFPPLRPDQPALHIAGAARLDGRLLAAALLRAAERLGARLIAGSAALLAEAGRVRGVTVGGERIEADRVVVTAGAWAPALLRAAGVHDPVQPQRGQILHLRLEGVDTSAWPVLLPITSQYMLAFPGGRIVAGATRETGSGFDYRVTAGGQMHVLEAALALAPGLADATIIETRIGFRPAGRTNRPVIGPVPGVEGLLLGNGLWASGLAMGPLAGRLLAQCALGQRTDLDMAPFQVPG